MPIPGFVELSKIVFDRVSEKLESDKVLSHQQLKKFAKQLRFSKTDIIAKSDAWYQHAALMHVGDDLKNQLSKLSIIFAKAKSSDSDKTLNAVFVPSKKTAWILAEIYSIKNLSTKDSAIPGGGRTQALELIEGYKKNSEKDELIIALMDLGNGLLTLISALEEFHVCVNTDSERAQEKLSLAEKGFKIFYQAIECHETQSLLQDVFQQQRGMWLRTKTFFINYRWLISVMTLLAIAAVVVAGVMGYLDVVPLVGELIKDVSQDMIKQLILAGFSAAAGLLMTMLTCAAIKIFYFFKPKLKIPNYQSEKPQPLNESEWLIPHPDSQYLAIRKIVLEEEYTPDQLARVYFDEYQLEQEKNIESKLKKHIEEKCFEKMLSYAFNAAMETELKNIDQQVKIIHPRILVHCAACLAENLQQKIFAKQNRVHEILCYVIYILQHASKPLDERDEQSVHLLLQNKFFVDAAREVLQQQSSLMKLYQAAVQRENSDFADEVLQEPIQKPTAESPTAIMQRLVLENATDVAELLELKTDSGNADTVLREYFATATLEDLMPVVFGQLPYKNLSCEFFVTVVQHYNQGLGVGLRELVKGSESEVDEKRQIDQSLQTPERERYEPSKPECQQSDVSNGVVLGN